MILWLMRWKYLESNPMYAHVRLPDGRETTVSLHQLAPIGETSQSEESGPEPVLNIPLSTVLLQKL